MNVAYDYTKHAFIISEGSDVYLEIEFPFIDNNDGNKFSIPDLSNYIFKDYYKNNIKENDIVTLYLRDKHLSSNGNGRIGWAIPYTSLISREHDYANKAYFAEYAFVLYYKILSDVKFQSILLTDGNAEFYPSYELYCNESRNDSNTKIAFVAEKSNFINNTISFDEFDYSAMQYGYSPTRRFKDNSFALELEKTIKLKRTSGFVLNNNVYTDPYYKDFIQYISKEQNPNIRFFHLYQVIETIISKLLIEKLSILMDKAKKGLVSSRDFESYLKNNTEYDRLKFACENSSLKKADCNFKTLLHNECDSYLISKGHDSVEFPKSLYNFRNQMIHRFRIVVQDEDIVDQINDLFELVILEMLLSLDFS